MRADSLRLMSCNADPILVQKTLGVCFVEEPNFFVASVVTMWVMPIRRTLLSTLFEQTAQVQALLMPSLLLESTMSKSALFSPPLKNLVSLSSGDSVKSVLPNASPLLIKNILHVANDKKRGSQSILHL
ncbi:hypothetical protein Sjap_021550 [Stephania japonica]|uniref:Uncharacterized protein n=1 Tax=Stephania japonica TaxID=461633 RepID=A0AAP0EUD2_9MAGN